MYMPNTFHNTPPTKATTVNAKSTATLIKVILISRSTWSHPRSGASRVPTRSSTIVGRVCVPDPLCTPLPYKEKYGPAQEPGSLGSVSVLGPGGGIRGSTKSNHYCAREVSRPPLVCAPRNWVL